MVRNFKTIFFKFSHIVITLNIIQEILLQELFLQKMLLQQSEIFLKDQFLKKETVIGLKFYLQQRSNIIIEDIHRLS